MAEAPSSARSGTVAKTGQELLAEYSDPQWRERLAQLDDLSSLLADSVIKSDYVVPDELNRAIALTPAGERVLRALSQPVSHKDGQKSKPVKPNEVRLMCMLELVHIDPLIDPQKSNLDSIVESIDRQIKEGRIAFPHALGRDLYDEAHRLFAKETPMLSEQQTQDLLSGTGPGVVQAGHYLAGPFGLLRSDALRYLLPGLRLPLYHCSDAHCRKVHRTHLATSREASINSQRSRFARELERISHESSLWGEFFAEVRNPLKVAYDASSPTTLPHVLGDCLSKTELTAMVTTLAHPSNTDSTLMRCARSQSLLGRDGELNRDLSHAEILQLLLLLPDESLIACLDELIAAKTIEVPVGEVREPVVNRYTSGAFAVRGEIGCNGIRFTSRNERTAHLRLRALIDSVYDVSVAQDEPELDWQLRGIEAHDKTERLSEFLRNYTPRQVVERLLLSRYTHVVQASQELGVLDPRSLTDEDLVEAILWKLGFGGGRPRLKIEDLDRYLTTMDSSLSAAEASAMTDVESVRAAASNMFVALEDLLDSALTYAVWALTTDHYRSPRPFLYAQESVRAASYRVLSGLVSGGEKQTLRFDSERMELNSLCEGFRLLADELESRAASPDSWSVTPASLPKFTRHTRLKEVPFVHRCVFLDLSESSQASILEALRQISWQLANGAVPKVRNDFLHFRRRRAEFEGMRRCLSALRAVRELLVQSGLAPMPFSRTEVRFDEWGRGVTTLTSELGSDEVRITSPSRYDWIGLPALSSRQYLLPSARFGDPNDFLRFSIAADSDFSRLWLNYPKFRQKSDRGVLDSTDRDMTAALEQPAQGQ